MRYLLTQALLISITAYGITQNGTANFNVEYKGALKNMMHANDISAKVELSTFKNIKHFYALGALENLKGEIQILDSRSFNTMVVNDSLIFDESYEKSATLLVYATVEKWRSVDIPDSVLTYEQFEYFIDKAARQYHLDINEPFPFLIEGIVGSFDWHVINWKDGDTEHSHEKHVNSGLHGTWNNKEVVMLGFYSNAHHAIFTHHTTNMHIHVKTTNNILAGHVDGLTLGKGMVLKLPYEETTSNRAR